MELFDGQGYLSGIEASAHLWEAYFLSQMEE